MNSGSCSQISSSLNCPIGLGTRNPSYCTWFVCCAVKDDYDYDWQFISKTCFDTSVHNNKLSISISHQSIPPQELHADEEAQQLA